MHKLYDHIKKNSFFILTCLSIVFFFTLGAKNLGKFVTADEHYWLYERIPGYWQAWHEGKYKKTLINDKPGITVAFFSGSGMLSEPNPKQHDLSDTDDISLRSFNTDATENLYKTYRYPILTVNAGILLFLFWVIQKISSKKIAFWSVFFMVFSPVILGMSRIINPDALLWSLSASAFFSYVTLLKLKEKKYVFFTALFTGLAIITKYTANILFPLYALLLAVYLIFWTQSKKKEYFKTILTHSIFLAIIVVGSMIPMMLLLPAVFVKPIYAYRLTLGFPHMILIASIAIAVLTTIFLDAWLFKSRIVLYINAIKNLKKGILSLLSFTLFLCFTVLIIGRVTTDFEILKTIPFDIKNISDIPVSLNIFDISLLQFNPIVFSTPPILLVLTLFSWYKHIFRSGNQDSYGFLVFSASTFITAYIVANSILGTVLTPRYSIMIYPMIAFLSAIGMSEIQNILHRSLQKVSRAKKYKHFIWIIAKNALPLLALFFSVVSILSASDFFHSYTNVLLPKKKLISDTWGASGYFAAQYLNTLPDAENITVWSDYYGVCEFFRGKCTTKYTIKNGQFIDYFVLTRRGKIRYDDMHIKWEKENGIYANQYYEGDDEEWSLFPHGRTGDFIRIVQADKTLRAGIITDIDHCPSRSYASKESLERFLGESRNFQSNFIVSLGDNASHRLRNCSLTADMDAREIVEYIRSEKIPSYFVLGDHDIASSDISYKNWLETIRLKKPFYSFDTPLVHVIVLDTVTGGEPLVQKCHDIEACRKAEEEKEMYEKIAKNRLEFETFLRENAITKSTFSQLKSNAVTNLIKEIRQIDYVRNSTHRDKGMVLERELDWLRKDLMDAKQNRILVFSDHPLFSFTSNTKAYNILNGEKVRNILESSGKQIVAISGEAHLWHEIELHGVHYYIVDEFKKNNGSWALFLWDETGYHLEKVPRNNVLLQ